MQVQFLSAIDEVAPAAWDALFPGSNPFLQHRFLQALEGSGAVAAASGWHPQHLVMLESDMPVAGMPLYLKDHSFGEFVFDWGWAEAYRRHGLAYYPKLLTAVPFTPSIGPRIGLVPGADRNAVNKAILGAVRDLAAERGCSGWHLLFGDAQTRGRLAGCVSDMQMMSRHDVQFHWRNPGFGDFDDFLGTLRSSKRKNLRRERRRVRDQGISLVRKPGGEIDSADWDGFYRCYVSTFLKRSGHGGYLNREFFERIRAVMADQLLLVVARRSGELLASALFFHDRERLYGRYWGALEDVPCLHFEACFYQGMEFCIEQGLTTFDPGTQGEHKLLRGFEPVRSVSLHWLRHREFRAAVGEFLRREKQASDAYGRRAEEFLPFRRNDLGHGD